MFPLAGVVIALSGIVLLAVWRDAVAALGLVTVELLFLFFIWQGSRLHLFADRLARSEEAHSLALEGAGVAIWDWDYERDKVVWGGSAWRILGAASNDAVINANTHVSDRMPEDDRKRVKREIDAALSANKLFSVEFRVNTFDGRDIWAQSRGKATAFRNGAPIRVSGTLIDITDRKQIEHDVLLYQKRLEAILDNMVDGLVTIDEKAVIQSANRACSRIFGYTVAEILGKNVKILMPQAYAAQHDQYVGNYIHSGDPKIIGIGREVEGRRKDGSVFPLDLAVAAVQTDTTRFFIGIVRDISARKTAEMDLKRSNEELEKFAYVASHDLKAPLRNIDDLAKWVAEDTMSILPEDAREKLDLLRGRIADLERLLGDILDYSRAGRIVDNPVRVDVQELAERLVAIHVPEGFTARIKGHMPVVFSPQTPLEQVFGNLLSNAVMHHDEKTGVIEIESRDTGGNFHEFIVRDDGPGIAPEFHTRVFEMFQTLRPRDKAPGSGLGLSIVKKLVEWQGGKCWIAPGGTRRGTEIHFTWPRGSADSWSA